MKTMPRCGQWTVFKALGVQKAGDLLKELGPITSIDGSYDTPVFTMRLSNNKSVEEVVNILKKYGFSSDDAAPKDKNILNMKKRFSTFLC